MKRLLLLTVLISIFGFIRLNAQTLTQQLVDQALENLPFPKFSIECPQFPNRVFNIKDEGAIGDGLKNNSKIINETISKCSTAGGGTVIIPAGLWKTGPITMKSNVNLHLDEGAIVSFSSDLADYELIKNGSKYTIPSLINGEELKNVAITGNGIFNGTGEAWRPVKKSKMNSSAWKDLLDSGGSLTVDGKIWYPRKDAVDAMNSLKNKKSSSMTLSDYQKAKAYYRPYMLNLEHCENVLIEGVTLQNSPKFCMMMRSITGLVVYRVKALNDWWAQNADGLDISACKNVLMYQCTVNTGDDGICMKSSHEEEGEFRLENIVIRDCKVFHGHGGFVIGSNTDGKMQNIYVTNCSFSTTDVGLRFKSGVGRGGLVTGIFVDGIYMKGIKEEAILFDLTYEDKGAIKMKDHSVADEKIPDFDGFSIQNVFVDGAETACRVDGFPACHVKNLLFKNWVMQTHKGMIMNYSEDIVMDSLTLKTKEEIAARIMNVNQLTINDLKLLNSAAHVQFLGNETKNIQINSPELDRTIFHIGNEVNKAVVSWK